MNPIKPGWQTTEFWSSIFALVVALAVSLHVIPAADSATVMAYLNAIATSAIALGGALYLSYHYIESRIAAKADYAHLIEMRERNQADALYAQRNAGK